MLIRTLLVTFLSVCIHLHLSGQHDCSAHGCFHAEVINNPFSLNPDTTDLDTNLRHFYTPYRFAANILFPAITGTTGHPAIDLFRQFTIQDENYFYHNPYMAYQLNGETMPVIITDVPYTEWYFLLGAHREQVFRALHAQSAGNSLNFGLDIKFINSKGAYTHEHARASHAGFYVQYRDPVRPLQSDLVLMFNNATTEENGGIADYSWFVDTSSFNRQLTPVSLNAATNLYRSTEISLRNRWYPGRNNGSATTAGSLQPLQGNNDTTVHETVRPPRINQHIALNLTFRQQRFLYRDTDPFNPWHPVTRYDTAVTHDSVGFRVFTADVAYHMIAFERVSVAAGFKYSAYSYYDTLMPHGRGAAMEPYTRWQLHVTPSIGVNAYASLRFDPDFGTAHALVGEMRWDISSRLSALFYYRDWTAFPMLQDQRHSSNHFYWVNDMMIQHFSQLNPVLSLSGRFPVRVDARLTRIGNLIYYDTRAMPQQHDGSITVWQLLLTSEWEFNRWVVDQRTGLQRASDETILRQPHILTNITVGYRFRLFEGKMTAMGGMIFHGTTTAYRDEYMPSTRVFYHTQRAPVNQYVWADPFLSLMLKRTRFLLTYQHASAWIAGFGQFELPGYPMQDPAFKFAVSWRFMD